MRLNSYARAAARSVQRYARTQVCEQRRITPLSSNRLRCFARASARGVQRLRRAPEFVGRGDGFALSPAREASRSRARSVAFLLPLFAPQRARRSSAACTKLKRAGRLWKSRSRSGSDEQTYENRPNGRMLSTGKARAAQQYPSRACANASLQPRAEGAARPHQRTPPDAPSLTSAPVRLRYQPVAARRRRGYPASRCRGTAR